MIYPLSDQTATEHLHVTAGYTQTDMQFEFLRQKTFPAGQNLGTWSTMPEFTKACIHK